MVVSDPALIRASLRVVSGSIRSMKKRPSTSLASIRSVSRPSALAASAALAILPHM